MLISLGAVKCLVSLAELDSQCRRRNGINRIMYVTEVYVSLRLRVQNAVPAQPCVGKLGISLVLLNFLHCNFRLWFKTS